MSLNPKPDVNWRVPAEPHRPYQLLATYLKPDTRSHAANMGHVSHTQWSLGYGTHQTPQVCGFTAQLSLCTREVYIKAVTLPFPGSSNIPVSQRTARIAFLTRVPSHWKSIWVKVQVAQKPNPPQPQGGRESEWERESWCQVSVNTHMDIYSVHTTTRAWTPVPKNIRTPLL